MERYSGTRRAMPHRRTRAKIWHTPWARGTMDALRSGTGAAWGTHNMKQTVLSLLAVVLLSASAAVRAEDAPAAPAAAAQEERIAQLEAQLKDALARIEKLEAEV